LAKKNFRNKIEQPKQQTKNEKDKTQNQNQQKQRINKAGILDTIQSLATKK
jgi:hypothetical protein